MTVLCVHCGATLTDEYQDNFDTEECRDCTDTPSSYRREDMTVRDGIEDAYIEDYYED